MAELLQIETRSGAPLTWKGARIIPFSRTVTIRLPGWQGGLIWNYPTSVWVQAPEGEEQVLPVRDITRQVVLALLSATFGVWMITSILRKRRK
jgi:hypothetical protein